MALADRQQVLQRLSGMIQAVEDKSHPPVAQHVSTAWAELDQAIGGGLAAGTIHEFFGPLPASPPPVSDGCHRLSRVVCGSTYAVGLAGLPASSQPRAAAPRNASPQGQSPETQTEFSPLCVLVHLAAQAAKTIDGEVIWIGRRCWPNPQFLTRQRLLERSLFVDASDAGTRLWAMELAMRSPAVAAVVGDAAGFNISATRRLQLAAREAKGLVLLSRPAREIAMPSAALSRWAVHRRLSDSAHPAWTLEVLRCKLGQGAAGAFRTRLPSQSAAVGDVEFQPAQIGPWPLEWNCAKVCLTISAAVVDRRAPSADPQARQYSRVG